jgi:hypothetical protein
MVMDNEEEYRIQNSESISGGFRPATDSVAPSSRTKYRT